MPVPYVLLSTQTIEAEEYQTAICDFGGVIEQSDPSSGRISDGEKHVWVYLNQQCPNDYDSEELAAISAKLRGLPQSCILLDVSRTDGSEQLAIRFSIECLKRWPSILDDFQGHLFTLHDLLLFQNTGKGFPKEVIESKGK